MTVSNEKFMTTTEFANYYNKSRPLGKGFMPLEPSFVKLLCEQGKLEHSVLPAHDGRKKDVYMIPESQLEEVDILLNDAGKDPKPENGILLSEEKLMTSPEVAKFLSLNPCYVTALAKEGKIKGTKVPRGKNMHGGCAVYMFKEEDVLAYAEAREKRKRAKAKDPKPDRLIKSIEKEFDINHLKGIITKLEEHASDLEFENSQLKREKKVLEQTEFNLKFEIKKLKEESAALAEVVGASADLAAPNQASDDDIFDAYRRGFKDGFEMGVKGND